MRKGLALIAVVAISLAVLPGTAAGAPQPSVEPPAAASSIVPARSYSVADGTVGVKSSEAWIFVGIDVKVYGEVWNRTSTRRGAVKVIATWVNASNEVIGGESAFTVLPSIAPGSIVPFVIHESSHPAGWYDYRLRVEPVTTQPGRAAGPLEVALESDVTQGGTRFYGGRVINRGSFAVDRGRVAVTVYIPTGEVLLVSSAALTGTLDPGEAWTFNLAVQADDRIHSHRLSAMAVQAGGNRAVASYDNYFEDVGDSGLRHGIYWVAQERISFGCGVARYCPNVNLPRDQMASFLARALRLPATSTDYFTDDEGNQHEANINRLRAAGITTGCTATTFCPSALTRRDEMASLLTRAFGYPHVSADYFTDDEGNSHEADINSLRRFGVAYGCGETTFCPSGYVTRGQIAAFIYRHFVP